MRAMEATLGARRVLRGSRRIFCETNLQPVSAREKYTTRRKAIREGVQASLRAGMTDVGSRGRCGRSPTSQTCA